MRHRIGGIGTSWSIGLGNPNAPALNNVWPSEKRGGKTLFTRMLKEALKEFFEKQGYVDFGIGEDAISVGVEPAYMYERLKIITIHRIKEESSITDGYAFGGWGTQIVKKKKKYSQYKRITPFTQFIDKWHILLFP